MGVLDDAIREHLELKRRHGASDDEIARQEAEALGPARRTPEAEVAAGEPIGGESLAEEPVAPPADLGDGALPSSPGEAAEPLPEPEPEPQREPLPEPEPLAVEPEPLAAGDETVVRDVEPVPPTEVAEPPPVEDTPPVGEAPVEEVPVEEAPVEEPPVEGEPPVEEEPPAEAPDRAAEDGDDLLEETPDRLQDTPYHDRLWFEQKPPRDFDLD
jgi:hypothetical protein